MLSSARMLPGFFCSLSFPPVCHPWLIACRAAWSAGRAGPVRVGTCSRRRLRGIFFSWLRCRDWPMFFSCRVSKSVCGRGPPRLVRFEVAPIRGSCVSSLSSSEASNGSARTSRPGPPPGIFLFFRGVVRSAHLLAAHRLSFPGLWRFPGCTLVPVYAVFCAGQLVGSFVR